MSEVEATTPDPREVLREVLRGIDAMAIIKRVQASSYNICYKPDTFRVAADEEMFGPNGHLFDPAEWSEIRFSLLISRLASDRFAYIASNDLLVAGPWPWVDFDELPDTL